MHPHRISRSALALLAASLLALAGCPVEGTRPAGSDQLGRYTIERIPLKRDSLMVRADTATGQAWHMRTLGEGLWIAYSEARDGIPSPDGAVSGRYLIRAFSQRRGAPTLVRVDTLTGRTWRTGSLGAGPWVAIPNPGEEIDPGAAPAGAAAS